MGGKYRLHDLYQQITPEAEEWFAESAKRHGFEAGNKYFEQKHVLWACLIFPNARNDRIFDAIKFTYVIVQFDDFIDDSPDSEISEELLDEYSSEIEKLDEGEPWMPNLPRLKMIAEFMEYMQLKMTPDQFDQFIKDFKCYLEIGILARRERGRLSFNNLDELINARRSHGGNVTTAIAWYAMGADGLDRNFWEDPTVKRLKDLYFDLSLAANDIYSFKKEDKNDGINYVIHFCKHEANGDLERAVKMTRDIIDNWYALFLKLVAEVKQREDNYKEDANKIILYMENFNPGCIEFAFASKRYKGSSD